MLHHFVNHIVLLLNFDFLVLIYCFLIDGLFLLVVRKLVVGFIEGDILVFYAFLNNFNLACRLWLQSNLAWLLRLNFISNGRLFDFAHQHFRCFIL